jgi:GTP cyclohydrolase II
MRNGNGGLSALFGAGDEMQIDRGLTELRAGRPIHILDPKDPIAALPVEGLTSERLSAFEHLCAPHALQLIVSTTRARAIGLASMTPMALAIGTHANPTEILRLVTDPDAKAMVPAQTASFAASSAVAMMKLAHGLPAVLAAPLTHDAGAFGQSVISVQASAVGRYQKALIRSLTIAGEARVPIAGGASTRFVVFRDRTGIDSVAVVIGNPDLSTPVPVRLHSACLTGDVFGSRRCDCGDQLRLAISRIDAAGGGVVLYLPQEGRGLGLVNKMRAYGLQDDGLDTIDANTMLGFDDDERDYGVAGRMLELLGIQRVRLMTNNPTKVQGLTEAGIDVAGRMPIEAPVNADNRRYLTAKAERAGHQLEHLIAAIAAHRSPEAVR